LPYGANETVYLLVVGGFASGTVYRETEIEHADLETIISDLMRGEFNAPVRVVAFNTWSIGPTMCRGRWPRRYRPDATSRASRCRSTSGTSSRPTAPARPDS
jgi:hypothetical protein